MTTAANPHAKAQRHLSRATPAFRDLIKRVGPCTLAPHPDPFVLLVRCIISQQISGKAAESIAARLELALAPRGIAPAGLRAMTDEALQACGLSGPKRKSIRDILDHLERRPRLLHGLAQVDDDELRSRLLPIHGVGPWTIEMMQIFGLGHTDVLPVGDLGLRLGVKELFGLAEVPGPKELVELAEPWRPYRTVATWYLWKSRS